MLPRVAFASQEVCSERKIMRRMTLNAKTRETKNDRCSDVY